MRVIAQSLSLARWAFLLAASSVSAEYRFDVWTAESGLPQNTVRAILQSRDGYLWVATLDGLARFDGVRFTVFNKANSPLTSNRILALYEDPQGALWIGQGGGGLACYRRGHFTVLGFAEGLTGKGVGSIAGDEHGNLWIFDRVTPSEWKDGRFVPVFTTKPAFLDAEYLRGNRPGVLWGSNQDGLLAYSRGKLITLNSSNGLPSLRVNQIDEDQHGTWWLAADDGLLKMRDGKVVKVYTQRDGLPGNTVNPLTGPVTPAVACEDRRGNVWVNGAGPWLGRLKDGGFSAYDITNVGSTQPFLLKQGARGWSINALYEDREGNLWIGTEGSGLIRAREQAVRTYSTGQGLRAANIYPICEDHTGAVWLGTWDQGLARIKEGMATNFPFPHPYELATALCEDQSGRLWVGMVGHVAIFQDGVLSQAAVPTELRTNSVNAIYQDRSGAVWFGAERGLFRLQNGELAFFSERDGLAATMLTVIIEDRDGALWIGSQDGRTGLTRLAGGRFTSWTEADGLPSSHVRALYEDADGTLWIGTADAGLGRFKQGRFTRYTTREGMHDNGVFQILEDARGNFWMSSNRGIHRVSELQLNEFADGRRRSITSIAYGKSDGMLNAECNGGAWPAGVKTRDGKLWFPTQDGVAIIDPATLSTNPTPPSVVIESFLVEHQPQSLERAVDLPPGKSSIEIEYTGLSLVNSEQLRFKYRLAGADEDWLEAGTRRTAYYSHLAPGHYDFTVLAANSDGVWNDTGASLAFAILPAWYQTWWFRIVAVVGIAGVAAMAYRRRVARLERARAAEQGFSRRLMESQERERQRLAAELHDSVGQNLLVIKNRALMALEHSADPGRMSEQITEVSNMASQALREVRGMAQDLRPFQLDEMGLAKAIDAMTRRLADSSKIRFHSDIADLNGELPKEREIHFYRIVQELLTNIVKHSGATEATLTIGHAGQVLRALVQDNGCGFDAGDVAGEAPTHAGFGLRSIRERARAIGGRLQIESRAGEGTSVVVEVPIEGLNESTD